MKKKILLFVLCFLISITSISITNKNKIFSPVLASELDFSALNLKSESSKKITKDLISPIDLENFLDELIPAQLDNYNITGATISVVNDGSVYLEKGYGNRVPYSSLPVIANETLFRVGSISKTFTAIAVLQLVEDGILDLDTNVNEYLSVFQIPELYDTPITLRHLLTHTAGFEETTYSIIFASPLGFNYLENLLANRMPDIVHEPGAITAYSNYGLALAGYIVQEISGKQFETYVEEEIFTPLEMNSSTFMQPLPSYLSSKMSVGSFSDESKGFFEYISVSPAGAMSSTASDMGRFMIAMLNNGSINGNRILENETVELMLSDNFVTHCELPSIGLGVYEFDYNDQKIIGHGGDTIFFHSRMMMFPESNLGVFISYNSQLGVYAKIDFFNEFIDTYFPYSGMDIISLKGYKNRINKFTGFYISTRRAYSDKPEIKEYEWSDNGFDIKAKNGKLRIPTFFKDLEFIEISPFYFREASGQYNHEIAFVTDTKGRVTHMYANFLGAVTAMEKVHPVYFNTEIQGGILLGIESIIVLSLIYWGIRGCINLIKKKERKRDKFPKIARFWVLGSAVLSLSIIAIVAIRASFNMFLATKTYQEFGGFVTIPILYLLSIVIQISLTYAVWSGKFIEEQKPYWKLCDRIHYTFLTILSIIVVGFFTSWHFYGF